MDSPKTKKITDEKVALAKAEHYCAYQERSQQEVRDKLYEWGLWTDAVENIISLLIGGNYLNEERFAKAYTRGKFKQKGWGRIKIKQGLKFKKVPDILIKKALLTIDADDYLRTLEAVLTKKAKTITEKDGYKRSYKLQQYALSRGFEADLILDVLKNSDL
ncbi:RecX family transcriptional regulator [Mucilaginibacter sp. BJC16-A38]|uniref:regulatory protein RecX n=1 Tax=Mucilaginibacter phenanthrenivorans TaxID=1234842 RepID=UPI002157D1E8|nr:RecX family transcriptional regulator [Mucilaginibacter phenanthrenivorans]MCR8556372.1 RecX family transcriptional regulator [Mucilaginibacter phenanthrenivorans]